jgi:hypothetical protein
MCNKNKIIVSIRKLSTHLSFPYKVCDFLHSLAVTICAKSSQWSKINVYITLIADFTFPKLQYKGGKKKRKKYFSNNDIKASRYDLLRKVVTLLIHEV